MTGLTKLSDRRSQRADVFALWYAQVSHFNHWFPPHVLGRGTRQSRRKHHSTDIHPGAFIRVRSFRVSAGVSSEQFSEIWTAKDTGPAESRGEKAWPNETERTLTDVDRLPEGQAHQRREL